MRIRDLFHPDGSARDGRLFSFEFFPPRSEDGVARLLDTVADLEVLRPSFVSVTYGAGGGTRDRTLDIVERIRRDIGIEAAAHVTCVGHTREEMRALVRSIVDLGVENIVALRGDPPRGTKTFVPTPDGFRYASELIADIRAAHPALCIVGAAYPEGHIECEDRRADLRHLKLKADAGTDVLLTQLFFDNAFYFDLVRRARAAGISVPIIPGIMPVTNVDQIERFTSMCGATIPYPLRQALYERKADPEAVLELGVAYATAQCDELLRGGAPGIHFYTLNKSPATRAIVSVLRILRPWQRKDPAAIG
jgi:methylenetetrahydrofolate reductase (NADPH)